MVPFQWNSFVFVPIYTYIDMCMCMYVCDITIINVVIQKGHFIFVNLDENFKSTLSNCMPIQYM